MNVAVFKQLVGELELAATHHRATRDAGLRSVINQLAMLADEEPDTDSPEERPMNIAVLKQLAEDVRYEAILHVALPYESKLFKAIEELTEHIREIDDPADADDDEPDADFEAGVAMLKPLSPTLDDVLTVLRDHCASVTLDFAAND